MDTFDAVIVGGGPAGSTCARQLTRAGMKVAVVDRATFPRDKVCAGWITPAVVDLLDLDVDDYGQTRVFQPITGFHVGVMHRAGVDARYNEAVSFGIRRFEFDHYLLERSGATLLCGRPISSLRRRGAEWLINDAIATPMLVGAGGHFCPVARELNPGTPARPVVAAVEMEAELTSAQLARCRVPGDTPLLDFCDDFAGYGWCFRKGHFVNVGIGRVNARHLPRHAQSFLDRLIDDRVLPADVTTRLKGHAYLLSTRGWRINAANGVLLAGDAAGLADVHSGEGIRPAIESGLMAAAAIVEANGNFDHDRLTKYEQALMNRFAPAAASEKVAALMPRRVARGLARQLMNSSFFVRRVVLDRWFLGRDRPPLRPPLSGVLYESC